MGRTILLADDSPTIRKIVELTFSDSDLRIEAVGTGDEALQRFESLHPDLVLADVVMPEPSGYEICRVVKGSGNPVPVLLLAGTFEPFDQELAKDCGADGHMVKPFESRALRLRVESLLAPPQPAAEEESRPAGTPGVEGAVDSPPEGERDESAGETMVETERSTEPETEPESPTPAPSATDPELIEAVAREVVKRISTDVLREIAWEVVPDLAAQIIRERIRELEREDRDDD